MGLFLRQLSVVTKQSQWKKRDNLLLYTVTLETVAKPGRVSWKLEVTSQEAKTIKKTTEVSVL